MDNQKNIINKLQIISALFQSKKYLETISKVKKLLHILPNNEFLNNMLGLSYTNIGKLDEAKSLYLRVIKLNPSIISYQNNYANVLKALNETEKAEEILERVIERKPDYINAINNLANLKKTLKKYEEAIKLYNKALSLTPENSIMMYNLALCYRSLRDFEKVKEYALKINISNPNFTLADKMISEIHNYKNDDIGHYETMMRKLNDINIDDDLANLYFAMAKANEDKNKYEQSFEFLRKANQLRGRERNYNLNFDILEFDNIKKIFLDMSCLNLKYKNQDNKIIFICGMPRSGTTLVEQIVSAHSKVISLGETDYIQKIANKEFENFSPNLKENINNKFSNNIMYEEYTSLIKKINSKEKIYTDKSLLNFKFIGFIKLFFPSSKIIVLRRDLNNNLLSIYKNDLQAKNLGWTFNIEQIIKYYNLFADYLMFWEKSIKNSFLEVKYENLVNDSTEISKKIINYCELDWEDGCLKYYNNKSAIDTASVNQASKPIYKSSLNNFENFKKYFNLK